MKNAKIDFQDLIKISNQTDEKVLFEQYKLVIASLDKVNDMRETGNIFWVTINSFLVSSSAYLMSAKGFALQDKNTIILALLALGIFLASLWIRALFFIKKSVDLRNLCLLKFEEFLPGKVFTFFITKTDRFHNKGSLTLNQMLVPVIFILFYIFLLAGLLER